MRSAPTFRGASTLTKSARAVRPGFEPYLAAFSCEENRKPRAKTAKGLISTPNECQRQEGMGGYLRGVETV